MNTTIMKNWKDFTPDSNLSSPFKFYPDEKIVRYERVSSHGLSLTDLDKVILITVNKLLVCTSFLLTICIQNHGTENVTHDMVSRRLRILTDNEYLTASYFQTNDPTVKRSSNNFYKLGFRGSGFLKANGIQPNHTMLAQKMSSTQIKRYLSAAQFAVKGGFPLESIEAAKIVLGNENGDNDKKASLFRPQVTITHTADGKKIFVESIRQEKYWGDPLLDKLSRINKVANLRRFSKEDSLILIAEDSAHMQRVMRFYHDHFYCFPMRIIFTCDTLINKEFSSCLYELKPGLIERLREAI